MINSTPNDISSATGPPTSPAETNSSTHSHEDEYDTVMIRSRKSYPRRNNRPKLNYRDLERGVYDRDELRQSSWALGGPTFVKREANVTTKTHDRSTYSDEEEIPDDDDETVDEQIESNGNQKSNDETEQMHRRLWCICRKPWDHSRLMLRCDLCANWYHGDCIGMTKEQAKISDMKGEQFVCPPCKGVGPKSTVKSNRLSDDSLMMKRKHISPSERKTNENPSTKVTPQSEPSKRPKTGIFFHRDSTPTEPQIHCIVHGCSNWAKVGWVYCSPACIRRHINETLQAIQRSKGTDNENPPLREDVLLYENRTKKVLDRKLVPKIEDLCTWINQHPSYEIVKPALRQSILLTANEPKALSPVNPSFVRSTSVSSSIGSPKTPTTPTTTNKIKPSWVPIAPNTKSAAPVKKTPVMLTKPTATSAPPAKSTGQNNTADIRSKVPVALYDKLLMRLEKSGEKTISNDEIRSVADKLEEEMFRVYGKVDNSYKNKFRSLLANISNMNNNYFYKQILSKEVTAKQIVAMKPEDMLPPEEKEKRKDEFEKEVQMIIKAEEQSAEEMARRARIKVTRQGLVENDAVLPIFKPQETNIVEPKDESTTAKPVIKPKKTVPTPQTAIDTTTEAVVLPKSSPSPPPPPPPEPTVASIPIPSEKVEEVKVSSPPTPPPSVPIVKPSTPVETNPTYSSIDVDNDYIEPESPTGIDALIYDDDDDLNNASSYSRSSSVSQSKSSNSPTETPIREDYNPLTASKPKIDSSSTLRSTTASRTSWRGSIQLPDAKLHCQSHRIFGESDYLVPEIPEHLNILGRLRLGDLWTYARDSLPVRDVVILTLTSENPQFIRYVETMRTLGRAAVLSKCVEPTSIRDMYILAADTKDCPSTLLSALSIPATVDSKHLFLVVISSGKRTVKSSSRPNDTSSIPNLTYKPVSLQEISPVVAPIRDPRLSRAKDPRLPSTSSSSTTKTTTTTTIPSTAEIIIPPVAPILASTFSSADNVTKIVNDTFEHIRHASSLETIQSLAHSTMEFLKSNGHLELYGQFAQQLPTAIATWQTGKTTEKKTELPNDDNLNEENMEVEDQPDDRQSKKNLTISEFNDVDYRFLDQDDMDHRLASLANNDQDSDLRAKETKRI